MTVNTKKIKSGPYIGNGLVDTFNYDFGVEDNTELRVFETDDSGVRVELVVDTDFTVNNIGEPYGTVTRIAGPLPTDYTWFIRSNYQETQETAFESQGAFFPDVHEHAFDKAIKLIQQISENQSRTLTINEGFSGDLDLEIPDPASGDLLIFTEDGIDLTKLTNKIEKSGDSMTGPLNVVDDSFNATAMTRGSIYTLVDTTLRAIAGLLPGVNEDYGYITTPVTEIKDYGTIL